MTAHLGGPEGEAKVVGRHQRYLALRDAWMLVIEVDGEAAGTVGAWPITWADQEVYEAGWAVLPLHQGRGLAAHAVLLLLEHLRSHGDRSVVHAFPKVDHPASNAVCRRTGFALQGERAFEYPKGNQITVHDWRRPL